MKINFIKKIIDIIRGNNGLIYGELYYFRQKKSGIENNKFFIEKLFVGSSHCQAAVNTDMFSNKSAFNLGIGSQDLYYAYKLYEKYVEELPKLKCIFLFYSVFLPGYVLNMTMNRRYIYYYETVFGITPQDIKKNLDDEKELKKVMRQDKKMIMLDKKQEYTGYAANVPMFDEKIALRDVRAHITHNQRDDKQNEFVIKICNIAKENNQNLYIIIPPHAHNYHKHCKKICAEMNADYSSLFNGIHNLSKELNIPVFDYFADSNFTDDDFVDWEHLAPSGAIKFTKLLKRRIGEK